MRSFEKELWRKGVELICGVDEVGRGPLAGPVVAAAVILPRGVKLDGVRDSKSLTPRQREKLYPLILDSCLSFGIGRVDSVIIDKMNILEATFLAMRRALNRLRVTPEQVLVDGLVTIPGIALAQTAIIKGDEKSVSIACASIVAKVVRDRLMECYDLKFPRYRFRKNKGYPTREHVEAILKYGPCEIHRRSFRPLRHYLPRGGH